MWNLKCTNAACHTLTAIHTLTTPEHTHGHFSLQSKKVACVICYKPRKHYHTNTPHVTNFKKNDNKKRACYGSPYYWLLPSRNSFVFIPDHSRYCRTHWFVTHCRDIFQHLLCIRITLRNDRFGFFLSYRFFYFSHFFAPFFSLFFSP